jgi:hypothetical protein
VVRPVGAASIKQLSFAERVSQAALIVRGRVVSLEAITRGTALSSGERKQKEARAPKTPAANQSVGAGSAIEEVGVEGGQMIFTRVTLEVEEELKGAAGGQLVFEIAGGQLGNRAVIIPDLPKFTDGQRYMLFLREGYEAAADPLVGVDQGFFEVVSDPTIGQDVLLDAKGDFVVAVDGDNVRVRRNAARATRPAPKLGAAPVPPGGAKGSMSSAQTSPEVLSYWQSTERPLSLQGFRQAVTAAQGMVR